MNRRTLRILIFGLAAAAFFPGAAVRAQNAVSGGLRLVVDDALTLRNVSGGTFGISPNGNGGGGNPAFLTLVRLQ